MVSPVGSSAATLIVGIAAFGCGYWWQCSDEWQDAPIYQIWKANVAMDGQIESVAEKTYSADDMRLKDNTLDMVLDTQRHSSVEADAVTENQASFGAPLDTQRDNSKEADMAGRTTDRYADPISDSAHHAAGMSVEDNASQRVLSFQENFEDEVVVNKYSDAPSWFSHMLILGLLCDAAVMALIAMCRLRQNKKRTSGSSEYDESSPKHTYAHPDASVAARTAAPSFVKATQPKSDEPLADVFTDAHEMRQIFVKAKQPKSDEPVTDVLTDTHEMRQPEIDVELQARINTIVQSRAAYRKEGTTYDAQLVAGKALKAAKQRQLNLLIDRNVSKEDTPRSASKEIASPSPAKSLSNTEIKYIAHMSLSAAKARNTPAKSPYEDLVAPCSLQWDAYDERMPLVPSISQNLQSMFDDDVECKESKARLVEIVEKPDDPNQSRKDAVKSRMEVQASDKEEAIGFDVKRIPSPCRRRSIARSALDSPNSSAKQHSNRSSRYQCSPQEGKINRAWQTPNSGAKDKGCAYQCSPQAGENNPAWQTPKSGAKNTYEHRLALRRAAALNAWGVGSPDQRDLPCQ